MSTALDASALRDSAGVISRNDPGARRLRVLSLSTVFPNPVDPGLGPFVRHRLGALARYADVTVLAPVPIFDYSSPLPEWTHFRAVPKTRSEGTLRVMHPRWAYPPGGSLLNSVCLYGSLLTIARRLHRRCPFHLLDSHFGFPEGIAASLLARALRIPFTVTLRGNEMVFGRKQFHGMALSHALRRANRIIAVSSELAAFAAGLGVERSRLSVISNGVDRDRFLPRDRTVLRRRHGLPSSRPILLTAGSLERLKGHHRVIQTLPFIVEQGFDPLLLVVGRPDRGGRPFDQYLRHLVARLGLQDRVRFLGWIPSQELAEIMAAADLYCHASEFEGSPNVVHEALACGTPVVAIRAGNIADLVPSDDIGFVVPPGSQHQLGQMVAQSLRKPWDRKRIAAWGSSRSWDDVAREVIREFEVVAPSTRHSRG